MSSDANGAPAPRELARAAALELRRAWAAGRRPRVEECLAKHAELAGDPQAVVELVYGEWQARRAAGEALDPADYERRFPECAAALRRQWEVDRLFDEPDPNETMEYAPGSVGGADEGPARIGRYLVLGKLGEGGQADVFRAVHPQLHAEVVLKLSRANGAGGDDALRAEGRILAGLEHPGLSRVYDLDFHEGRPFIVAEFVRGPNLRQAAADRTFSPAEAARLVAAVARAADHAHRHGVLHRDIKPANVILDPAGRPRLIDFGLASVRPGVVDASAADGSVSGTAGFMAPEQARGEECGPAADVFALGGVLYFLLTGAPPFAATTLAEALVKARNGDWDRAKLAAPGIPPRMADACRRAMATTPAERFPSAAAFADALDAALVPSPWPKRLAAVAGLALVVAAAWALRPKPPAAAAPPPAVAPATLEVAGWVGERYVPLPTSAPFRTRQRVRVEAAVPPGHRAALCLFDTAGTLTLLAEYPADAAIRFPQETGKGAPLTGPPGTEVVLLLARPGAAPIDAAEVAAAWGAPGTWPALPELSVLRASGAEVRVLQMGRSFGPAVGQADPEEEVRTRLAAAGARLRENFPVVEALAVRHVE